MNPRSFWAAALCLGAAGFGCTEPEDQQDLPGNAQLVASSEVVIDEVTAQSSGMETAAREVITDPAVWANAWNAIHQNVQPRPAPPAIDFAGSVVFLAAMGTRPTGGYSIVIEGVYRTDDRLYVVVRERSPGSNCVTTQALTAPVAAVSTAKVGLPVTFVERRETVDCH